ncbi:MAG TPA: HPP family protein [Terriglobales bacterium]|nr:HPP family protein [Terriglobales bacterium]
MPIRFWTARIPDEIWAPVWEAALILIVGITAWAAGQPWLFASLGPTAYEQAEKPHMKSARLYNVLVGHFVALGCGFLGVAIMHAWGAPKVNATTFIPMARLGASVIGVAATTLLCLKLKASQPAALSTTLLVTLGPYDTAMGALWIAVGVVIIAVVGEPVRRMRLSRPQSQ